MMSVYLNYSWNEGGLLLSIDKDSERERAREREKRETNGVRLRQEDMGDRRGWMASPLLLAREHGLEGALSCKDLSVGTILPGHLRANHRHHLKNESFLLWGAKAVLRLENDSLPKRFAEMSILRNEAVVFTAPKGRAHAIRNIDTMFTLNLISCSDAEFDPRQPDSDSHVWNI